MKNMFLRHLGSESIIMNHQLLTVVLGFVLCAEQLASQDRLLQAPNLVLTTTRCAAHLTSKDFFVGHCHLWGPFLGHACHWTIFCAIEGDRFAKLDVFKLVGSPTLILLMGDFEATFRDGKCTSSSQFQVFVWVKAVSGQDGFGRFT